MSKPKERLYDPTPIHKAMKKKKLSSRQAVTKIKMAEFTFRKIRNGQDVTLSNLTKAAKYFGLKVDIQIKEAA